MKMLKTTVLIAFAFSLYSFGAHAFQMFENAVRVGPTASQEGTGAIKFTIEDGGRHFNCTAFFVDNKFGRPYIMSARHCAGYEMAKACREGRLKFTTQVGSHVGTCKATLIETTDLDETLLLGNFPNWESAVRPEIEFYRLSTQRPRFNTRLEMMGYPADTERNGQFTVTRNCWISGNRMVTANDYPGQSDEILREFEEMKSTSPLFPLLRHRFAAFHNCSVYGGNSGGPILIEGTHTVLGLPTSYFPKAPRLQSQMLTTSMDATADFVERNASTLQKLGVRTAVPYNGGTYVPPFQIRRDANGQPACYMTTQLEAGNAQPADPSWCQ